MNPEGVLIEKVAPDEKMGHTPKFRGIVKARIRGTRRVQGHNSADAIGMVGCRSQAKIASLAMGQQDRANLHTLDQGVVGMLGEHIVRVPAGHALA